MITNIRRFWNDDSGPELVEWAVVTIILLVAAVFLYIAVGRALGAVICSIKCWLEEITKSHENINKDDCQAADEKCA